MHLFADELYYTLDAGILLLVAESCLYLLKFQCNMLCYDIYFSMCGLVETVI